MAETKVKNRNKLILDSLFFFNFRQKLNPPSLTFTAEEERERFFSFFKKKKFF